MEDLQDELKKEKFQREKTVRERDEVLEEIRGETTQGNSNQREEIRDLRT